MMEFEESKIDTHVKQKVFTAPISGLYSISRTLCYVNNIKLGIHINRAKMRNVKLSNKNLKKLRLICSESYTVNDTMRVSKDDGIVSEMKIPDNILSKIKHQIPVQNMYSINLMEKG